MYVGMKVDVVIVFQDSKGPFLFKMTFDLSKMDSKFNPSPSTHKLKGPFIWRGKLNETFPNVNVKVILKLEQNIFKLHHVKIQLTGNSIN